MIVDQALAYLGEQSQVETVQIMPVNGVNYAAYGGCYYQKIGRLIRVHIGVGNLTESTNTSLFTMPEGLRPSHIVSAAGTSTTTTRAAAIFQVTASGNVTACSSGTYACGDIYYII